MRASPTFCPLDWSGSPLEAAARWPSHQPLHMLYSGRRNERWARWSILTTPAVRFQFDGRSGWVGRPPAELQSVAFAHDPLVDVDAILNATRINGANKSNGFRGGWIGYFSYDLGRWIEPRAQSKRAAIDRNRAPLIDLAWCPDAALFDHTRSTWHLVSRIGTFEVRLSSPDGGSFAVGPLRSRISRDHYVGMVNRTKDYITAGDIFQANIAQQFSAPFEGSPRALCRAAFRAAQPWYGAYLEIEPRSIISLSPELFLHVDPTSRRITTRPIKGTRPASASPTVLADSTKDAAELHMIVDLMRNDLGRVCEFGSVQVPSSRSIEHHPTVQHGVGEVIGTLRPDVTFSDLLRATFPGGSVTGAPKIRAMQIIDELEPSHRGPYCGAIGYISDNGAIQLNIAIRTLLLSGKTLTYAAGAGIVADSDPASEYQETLDKTAVIRMLINTSSKPLKSASNSVVTAS